jgi:hypothetical protein
MIYTLDNDNWQIRPLVKEGPMTNKTVMIKSYAFKIWSWAPQEARRQDGLAVSCKVTWTRTEPAPTTSPWSWRQQYSPKLPSSTEVMNAWIYISTPPIRLHGVVLS